MLIQKLLEQAGYPCNSLGVFFSEEHNGYHYYARIDTQNRLFISYRGAHIELPFAKNPGTVQAALMLAGLHEIGIALLNAMNNPTVIS